MALKFTGVADRMDKKEFIELIAKKMNTDEETAEKWVDTIFEGMYEVFKQERGLTLKGFGGFYLDKRKDGVAFKFNPGQKLRALFGWSSSYKGEL